MSFRPKDTKERILHRLKIVQGHLQKVQQMVENDEYCISIIHQSQAVQKALKEIDILTLESHLHGCVTDAIVAGRKDEAITEVMEIFKKQGARL
jgi:DNA-binding FrmR family transcriptional regulator